MYVGILTVSSEEGDGGTLRAGTAGTTNSVDVILRVVRVVVVQHVSNVANILISERLAGEAIVCIATFQRGDMKNGQIRIYMLPIASLRSSWGNPSASYAILGCMESLGPRTIGPWWTALKTIKRCHLHARTHGGGTEVQERKHDV